MTPEEKRRRVEYLKNEERHALYNLKILDYPDTAWEHVMRAALTVTLTRVGWRIRWMYQGGKIKKEIEKLERE